MSSLKGSLFERDSRTLTINLRNGKQKQYTDNLATDDETDIKLFNIVQYFPEAGYALLHEQHYAGDVYFLVNVRTGREERVRGYPVLSPGRKRIAVANADVAFHLNPNMLKIYRLSAKGLSLEFDAMPEGWGASDIQWKSEKELVFYKVTLIIDFGGPAQQKERKVLKHIRGKWRIR